MGQNRDLSRFPNAITVLDNGNVGIGTTSFSEGTQPSGTISIIPNSSVSSGPLVQFAGNGRIRPASGGDRLSIDGNALYLNSYIGGNIIMNTAGGNVGIGGTPSVLLDANTGAIANSGYNGMRIADDASHFWFLIRKDSSGNKRFAIYNGQGVTPITLQEGGAFLGIGNTSPTHTVHIKDSSYNRYALRVQSDTGNTSNRWGGIGFSGEDSNTKAGIFFVSEGGSYSRGSLVFANNNEFNQNSATLSDERMRINKDGQITIPYQPAFYAFGASTTSTTGNYAGFNTTRLNRGGHYNTSNGRFTAPVAGVYKFVFAGLYRQQTGNSSGEISISVNGSNVGSRGFAYALASANTDTHVPCVAELTISLNANDYVMPFIYSCGANSDWYLASNLGYFTGYLLG
jgi:hypothetical protein